MHASMVAFFPEIAIESFRVKKEERSLQFSALNIPIPICVARFPQGSEHE
jgi:hypothetical protein